MDPVILFRFLSLTGIKIYHLVSLLFEKTTTKKTKNQKPDPDTCLDPDSVFFRLSLTLVSLFYESQSGGTKVLIFDIFVRIFVGLKRQLRVLVFTNSYPHFYNITL